MKPIDASVITLTLGRHALTKHTFDHNLKIANADYELLICDQGNNGEPKTEREHNWEEYLRSLNPDYLRLNNFNEGVARSLNQLMIRCTSDYIVFMPPDILLPENWLSELVDHARNIPNTGIVGFDGQDLKLPYQEVIGANGKNYSICRQSELVLDGCQVYGATLVTKQLLQTIGYYCEDYHPYSFEDADLCFRAHLSHFYVYYIPNFRSEHIGLDHGLQTDYKAAKLNSYFSNAGLHRWRMGNYWRIGLYVPPPTLRDPLI